MFKKIIAFIIVITFGIESTGYAQVAPVINIAASSSAGVNAFERFRPVQMRSLIYDHDGNKFNILVDKGDARAITQPQMSAAAARLMEYFRTGVALPNSAFWVNLRPDAPTNIIDPALEKTDLGKVFLETDLALKKDMALATSPNTATGRKYWSKLYAKAEELLGTRDVTVPTLTRPWIVPGDIIIRQSRSNAYVYKASLKVKIEQDHLKQAVSGPAPAVDPRQEELNAYATQLVREIILPALTKKVNSSRAYADFRQAFYSLVLAQWFKKNFKGTDSQYASLIDTGDLTGLVSKTPWSTQTYYEAYRKSFSEGEYNVSENVVGATGNRIRNYTSGGIVTDIFGGEASVNFVRYQNGFIPKGNIPLDGGTLQPVVMKGVEETLAAGANEARDMAASNNDTIRRDGGDMKRILKTAWWGVALPVALVSACAFNAVLVVTWVPFIIGTGVTGLAQVYAAFLPSLGATVASLGLGYLAGKYAEKRLMQRQFDRIVGQGIENQPFPKDANRDGGTLKNRFDNIFGSAKTVFEDEYRGMRFRDRAYHRGSVRRYEPDIEEAGIQRIVDLARNDPAAVKVGKSLLKFEERDERKRAVLERALEVLRPWKYSKEDLRDQEKWEEIAMAIDDNAQYGVPLTVEFSDGTKKDVIISGSRSSGVAVLNNGFFAGRYAGRRKWGWEMYSEFHWNDPGRRELSAGGRSYIVPGVKSIQSAPNAAVSIVDKVGVIFEKTEDNLDREFGTLHNSDVEFYKSGMKAYEGQVGDTLMRRLVDLGLAVPGASAVYQKILDDFAADNYFLPKRQKAALARAIDILTPRVYTRKDLVAQNAGEIKGVINNVVEYGIPVTLTLTHDRRKDVILQDPGNMGGTVLWDEQFFIGRYASSGSGDPRSALRFYWGDPGVRPDAVRGVRGIEILTKGSRMDGGSIERPDLAEQFVFARDDAARAGDINRDGGTHVTSVAARHPALFIAVDVLAILLFSTVMRLTFWGLGKDVRLMSPEFIVMIGVSSAIGYLFTQSVLSRRDDKASTDGGSSQGWDRRYSEILREVENEIWRDPSNGYGGSMGLDRLTESDQTRARAEAMNRLNDEKFGRGLGVRYQVVNNRIQEIDIARDGGQLPQREDLVKAIRQATGRMEMLMAYAFLPLVAGITSFAIAAVTWTGAPLLVSGGMYLFAGIVFAITGSVPAYFAWKESKKINGYKAELYTLDNSKVKDGSQDKAGRDGGMLLTNAKKRRLIRYLGLLAHNIHDADYRMREQSWSLYQPYFEESFSSREQFEEFALYVASAMRQEKLVVYGAGLLALASVALVTTVPAATIGCCAVFAAAFLWRAGNEYTVSKQDLLDALNYFSNRSLAFTGPSDAAVLGVARHDGGIDMLEQLGIIDAIKTASLEYGLTAKRRGVENVMSLYDKDGVLAGVCSWKKEKGVNADLLQVYTQGSPLQDKFFSSIAGALSAKGLHWFYSTSIGSRLTIYLPDAASFEQSAKDGGVKTEQERLQILEGSEVLYQEMLVDRIRHVRHSVESLKKMSFADQDLGGQSKTRNERLEKLAKVEKATDVELAASKKRLEGIKADAEELRKARRHNVSVFAENDAWATLLKRYRLVPGTVLHGACDLYGNVERLADGWRREMNDSPVRFEVDHDALGASRVSLFIVSGNARPVLSRIQEVLDDSFRDGIRRDGGSVIHSIVGELLAMLSERIQAKDKAGALEVMQKLYILANPRMQEKIEALARECNRRDFDKVAGMFRDIEENETYLDWKKWVGLNGLFAVDALQDAGGWYFWRDEREGAEIARKVARSDWGQNDGGSNVGGIDVREMSIATRQVSAEAMVPRANAGLVSLKELDHQWVEIRTDMAKGQKPYQKMKAYVEACNATTGTDKQLKAVTNCVANMVKHDEEEAAETSVELREIIAQLG